MSPIENIENKRSSDIKDLLTYYRERNDQIESEREEWLTTCENLRNFLLNTHENQRQLHE